MKSYSSSSRTFGGESTAKADRPFFCRRLVNFQYKPLKLEILYDLAYYNRTVKYREQQKDR